MSDSERPKSGTDRRQLLAGVAGLGAATALGPLAIDSAAGAELAAPVAALGARADRIASAFDARMEAARASRDGARGHAARGNGDAERFADGRAHYSKGLPHDDRGQVDAEAWRAFRSALAAGTAKAFSEVPAGGTSRLVHPLGAWSVAPEGCDGCQVEIAAPPPIDSEAQANEALELYWMALLRDVPFEEWESSPIVTRACRELTSLSEPALPKSGSEVGPSTLFRGARAGDLTGPYISQFLLKELTFGPIQVFPKVRTFLTGYDHLTTFDAWLAVQNGAPPRMPQLATHRYVRSLRDLAAYVYSDYSYQAFLGAALILLNMEGSTDARRPYRGAPYATSNPYRAARPDKGFVVHGQAYVLDLVTRVARAALTACWYQKWAVHLRPRPEEFGGLVERRRGGDDSIPVLTSLLEREALIETVRKHRSALLPQASPEGSPLHPSFPAGHAAIAGASATVLKALFDERFPIEEPVTTTADGLRLLPLVGHDLRVGGELEKLASNISFGRNAAGIHWRSDAEAGIRLGEEVAISVLREERCLLREESAPWRWTRFDGSEAVVA